MKLQVTKIDVNKIKYYSEQKKSVITVTKMYSFLKMYSLC